MERTHYAILGLPDCASLDDVVEAYIERCRELDRMRDLGLSPGEIFRKRRKLRAVYEILSDPLRKEAYDRILRIPVQSSASAASDSVSYVAPAPRFQKDDEVSHPTRDQGKVLKSSIGSDGEERVVVRFSSTAAKVDAREISLLQRSTPTSRWRGRRGDPQMCGEPIIRTTDGRYDSYPDYEPLDDESEP